MDPEVTDWLMDEYARTFGYEPDESWVLIVHPDGRTEYTPLTPGEPRWCCERVEEIDAMIRRELIELGLTGLEPPPVDSPVGRFLRSPGTEPGMDASTNRST